MGIISGGGGGGSGLPLTGGTLTGPLTVAPTSHSLTAETITMATGARANGTDWLLVVNDDGDNVFEGDASGYATFKTLANGTGFRVVTTNGTQFAVTPSTTSLTGPTGGNLTLASDGAAAGAVYFVGFNVVPAAGQLAAGDFALWLDKTNGAAKLMVEAKQANGTVVAAAIALA